MSHYSVVVCTDEPDKLHAILAPFDENITECNGTPGDPCPEDCTTCENRQAKWDWWVIGGRWGGYFPYHEEHANLVIKPKEQFSSPELKPGWCDGGPKFALNLDQLREDKAASARETYAEWAKLTEGTPEALPWTTFTENISEGNGYSIDQAREEYKSQPRIKALEASGSDHWKYMTDDPVPVFQIPEALYIERARAQAVPGWAILTLDGRWIEQGSMGWFGWNDATEASRIGYWKAANAYIESLSPETFLIAVDAHI